MSLEAACLRRPQDVTRKEEDIKRIENSISGLQILILFTAELQIRQNDTLLISFILVIICKLLIIYLTYNSCVPSVASGKAERPCNYSYNAARSN